MPGAPPKFLVLPSNTSDEARICTLAHPRTSNPCRYYFDPHHGLYEFTRISAARGAGKSWLLKSKLKESSPDTQSKTVEVRHAEANKEQGKEGLLSGGYVVKDAELLVATPIDYLFILLPALCDQHSAKSEDSKRLFQSSDDLLERLIDNSQHFTVLADDEETRSAMETRMRSVCDTVDADYETMYRLNEQKLLNELFSKAKNVVAAGLPPSMEEKFVRRALEVPIASIKHENSFDVSAKASQSDTGNVEHASLDSQASTGTSTSTASSMSISTDITVPDEEINCRENDDIRHLLRLRIALTYMISTYLPTSLAETVTQLASLENSPIDFKPLDIRLAEISSMRAEVLASRSLGDFSRKRNMHEDDDARETMAEKKRKKEEEEKRKKASETRGLRDLKKVDTKGMKKMSDFFGKKAATKK